MRLDKYLKVSRIIKRSMGANGACDSGRGIVNGKPAKESLHVKQGDVIEIAFGSSTTRVRVLDVKETVRKDDAQSMYEILS